MFNRIISVDWSGAGLETDRVDLRVVEFNAADNESRVVPPPDQDHNVASWSRQAFRSWITRELLNKQPALVVMDFGFGLPWGSDGAIFQVAGSREMISAIANKYREKRTARATALSINSDQQFGGHGPYRFNDNRNDFRFYAERGIAYYRLTELIAPEAKSQWYLGAGATVGFHTITGMAALHHLLEARQAASVDFCVWPHECLVPDGTRHVVAESYPATCSDADDFGPCRDQHQRDAWKVLQMLLTRRNEGTLQTLFRVRELPFGRISRVDFQRQIQFEGYIVGLT